MTGRVLLEQEPFAYQEFTETGEWFLSYSRNLGARQNPLFLAGCAQQYKPLTAKEVRGLCDSAGYDTATPEERADFINGIRHGELAHGINQRAES